MYFIYDCGGTVIGNPKGYRTFRGAERAQNFTLHDVIWMRFYARANQSCSLVSSIKLK